MSLSPCNAGSIGYEVAKTLAGWAPTIVATGLKNIVSLREALQKDMQDGGLCPDEIEAHPLDLSGLGQRRGLQRLVQRALRRRLDVLVNNASILLNVVFRWGKPRFSADGFEMHWRTNYLGAFHLTRLLLPMLLESGQRTGDARVINVSSHHHDKGKNNRPFRDPGQARLLDRLWPVQAGVDPAQFRVATRYRADCNLRSVALHPALSART